MNTVTMSLSVVMETRRCCECGGYHAAESRALSRSALCLLRCLDKRVDDSWKVRAALNRSIAGLRGALKRLRKETRR